jgi:uncharacterized membrane protein
MEPGGAMSTPIRILLAGESWVSSSTHVKGFDFFSSSVYEEGLEHLKAALPPEEFELVHLPGHRVPAEFPLTTGDLDAYDIVILSDIGANSILLHPDVWLRGKTVPNRLEVLRDWVSGGGALVMCGGYLSFAGIYGSAKFYGTPVEDVLPVTMHERDDRVEAPQGARVSVRAPEHPILAGITGEWPLLLGYNEVIARPEATLLAEIDGKPFLAVMESGKGRSLVWTSDIGPHWCPMPFLQWEGYARIWQQSMRWLAER